MHIKEYTIFYVEIKTNTHVPITRLGKKSLYNSLGHPSEWYHLPPKNNHSSDFVFTLDTNSSFSQFQLQNSFSGTPVLPSFLSLGERNPSAPPSDRPCISSVLPALSLILPRQWVFPLVFSTFFYISSFHKKTKLPNVLCTSQPSFLSYCFLH